jgi:hypothetical protein
MLNEDFAYLVEEFGAPVDAVALEPSRLQDLRSRLPGALIDYWSELGIGVICDGMFQFCDPDNFEDIVDGILGNDPDFFGAGSVCCYGYSAFSELYGWHKEKGSCTIDLMFGVVDTNIPSSDREKSVHSRVGPDRRLPAYLSAINESGDIVDAKKRPLFARARKKLGKLSRGECYGFVPAIGIGGAIDLQYLQRLPAAEHFAFISGLRDFEWTNVTDGIAQNVRTIQS